MQCKRKFLEAGRADERSYSNKMHETAEDRFLSWWGCATFCSRSDR